MSDERKTPEQRAQMTDLEPIPKICENLCNLRTDHARGGLGCQRAAWEANGTACASSNPLPRKPFDAGNGIEMSVAAQYWKIMLAREGRDPDIVGWQG